MQQRGPCLSDTMSPYMHCPRELFYISYWLNIIPFVKHIT